MLGCPGASYRNPRELGQVTQSLYVYVDDVNKHFQHAKASRAKIVEEPADQFYGDRRTPPRIPRATSGTSRSTCEMWRPRR